MPPLVSREEKPGVGSSSLSREDPSRLTAGPFQLPVRAAWGIPPPVNRRPLMTTTPDLMITLRLAPPRHFMRLLSLRVGAESSDMHNEFICCFSPASPRCCWAFKTFHILHLTTAFSFGISQHRGVRLYPYLYAPWRQPLDRLPGGRTTIHTLTCCSC